MQISLPCITFARLASAAFSPSDKLTDSLADRAVDPSPARAVRFEIRAGKVLAIATNFKILAVELVGETTELDGDCAVTIDPVLLTACVTAAQAEDALLNVVLSEGWAVASLSNGYLYPANAFVPGDLPKDWRLLFQNTPTRRNGAMSFDADQIARLGLSSPSGSLVFPQVIDGASRVIVNDILDPDWMGVFMSIKDDDKAAYRPATVKGWI